MKNDILPVIDPEKECHEIAAFLKKILQNSHHTKVILAVSGGIDSAVTLSLLAKMLPVKNIFVVHLPYYSETISQFALLCNTCGILPGNRIVLPIHHVTEDFQITLGLKESHTLRRGNIMARIRMVLLYDLAKKYDALVVGTENKSEYMLGYFTRFGDEASDIEIIRHLYKTQVYQLAKYLDVPEEIINQYPTAGLWEGQTDEKELGFSYQEADSVLYLHFEKEINSAELKKKGFPHAEAILSRVSANAFKHHVPYIYSPTRK